MRRIWQNRETWCSRGKWKMANRLTTPATDLDVRFLQKVSISAVSKWIWGLSSGNQYSIFSESELDCTTKLSGCLFNGSFWYVDAGVAIGSFLQGKSSPYRLTSPAAELKYTYVFLLSRLTQLLHCHKQLINRRKLVGVKERSPCRNHCSKIGSETLDADGSRNGLVGCSAS